MRESTASESILHDYWRSGTSYRARIALNIKGVDYRQVTHDLRKNEQSDEAYMALINPQGLVPAFEHGGLVLTQSSAIIEWLEERFPTPALLPERPADRAIVRSMAMIVACDIHPLNNLRVLNAIDSLGADMDDRKNWIANWIESGFAALERLVAKHGGRFAFGDSLSLADCHIVPQIYSAQRFKIDLSPYPNLVRTGVNASNETPVANAHPDNQIDAD